MDNEIDLSKLSIEKLQAMKKENLENKWNYYHLMKNCDKMDKFYTYFIYKSVTMNGNAVIYIAVHMIHLLKYV